MSSKLFNTTMRKAILIKTYPGSMYRYIKMLAFSIALVVATSNFHTCVTNAVSPAGSRLKMEVTSGVDKHITAHFSLAEEEEEVILASYRLRVSLRVIEGEIHSNNLLTYTNGEGVIERVPNIDQPLSYFTREEKLDAESEIMVIPFNLIVGEEVTKIGIEYELRNEVGNIVSRSYVAWKRGIELGIANILIDHPEVRLVGNIATIDSSEGRPSNSSVIVSEAFVGEGTNMDIVEEIVNSGRKRKRISESLGVPGSSYASVERDDKVAKRIAKGKEKLEEDQIEEGQDELMTICAKYSQMNSEELAKLANSNDKYAQEVIIRQCLEIIWLNPLLEGMLDPLKWEKIKEKALQDQRYVFFLLCYLGRKEETSLDTEMIASINTAAISGNALAQSNLGYMYLKGIGLAQDNSLGLEWTKKAADQGLPVAQNNLGDVYLNGKGVAQDDNLAAAWYRKAADAGHVRAQYNLGDMYLNGKGVTKDDNLAAAWFRKAADQGLAVAQIKLGNMYLNGKGVTKDDNLAAAWFRKAADQGYAPVQYCLGNMYLHGKGVTKDDNLAAAWFRKAADQGLPVAQDNLGRMYEEGKGVEKDIAQAIYWFIQSKSKVRLLNILKFIPELSSNNTQISFEEELDIIEKSPLCAWQQMLVQKKLARTEKCAIFSLGAYQELEEMMTQLIDWNRVLKEKSGLMISCLQLTNPSVGKSIEERQKTTGIIPYVKQQVYQNKRYLSFGKENVELADKIVDELGRVIK